MNIKVLGRKGSLAALLIVVMTSWIASPAVAKEKRRVLQDEKDARVMCVAIDNSGDVMASGDSEKSVRLWDIAAGKVTRTIRTRGMVTSVDFSIDGKLLAFAVQKDWESPGEVVLWDRGNNEELATLRGHTSAIKSVRFSRDGRKLASSSNDKSIRLWDVGKRKEIATLKGHTDFITCITFSPDGTLLASTGYDKTLRLWNAMSGNEISQIDRREKSYSLAFSNDGTMLAIGGNNSSVTRVMDVRTEKIKFDLDIPGDTTNLKFIGEDRTLVTRTGGSVGAIEWWDLDTKKRKSYLFFGGYTDEVAYDRRGNWIAGVCLGTLVVLDLSFGTTPETDK